MIDCYLKFIYSYFSVAIKITCKSDWISHCPTVPHPQNERIYIHMQLTRSIKVVDGMVIPFLLINLLPSFARNLFSPKIHFEVLSSNNFIYSVKIPNYTETRDSYGYKTPEKGSKYVNGINIKYFVFL